MLARQAAVLAVPPVKDIHQPGPHCIWDSRWEDGENNWNRGEKFGIGAQKTGVGCLIFGTWSAALSGYIWFFLIQSYETKCKIIATPSRLNIGIHV